MQNCIPDGELFDKFLEFSDMSSVFKIITRIEYVILKKLIQKADENNENGGKVYLEDVKNDLNIPMPPLLCSFLVIKLGDISEITLLQQTLLVDNVN